MVLKSKARFKIRLACMTGQQIMRRYTPGNTEYQNPKPEALNHLEYRSDVDGLRAIAVLSVVTYHAFPDFLPAGFIGVDVFFVISGYLITGILLRGISRDKLSLADFYCRRIRRIFPALAIVLSASVFFSWFWLLPVEYSNLGLHVAAGAGFVSNLLLWNEAGYFNKAAELKPLLHLWSLGIEEQFYILWPVTLLLASKLKMHIPLFFAVLIGASLGLSCYWVFKNPVATFYLPLTRFWELLAGGLLAWMQLQKPNAKAWTTPAIANLSAWSGMLALALGLLLINQSRAFPGFWALFPVAGAFLLILAGPLAWCNRQVLSNRVLVFVGLISYPLYLWHWPLLSLARIVNSEPLSTIAKVLLLSISFVFACLTYWYVEKPIRRGDALARTVRPLVIVMVIIAVLGILCFKMQGFPSRFSEVLRPFAMFQPEFQKDGRTGICWVSSDAKPDAFAAECVEKTPATKPLIVVWGDSHAARFFPGMTAGAANSVRLAQWTRDACPPIMDYSDEHCIAGNLHIFEQIELLKPEVVIFFAAWNRYQGQATGSFPIVEFQQTVDKLVALGIPKLVIMGPVAQWKNDLPGTLVRSAINNNQDSIPSRTFQGFDTSVQQADEQMQAAFGQLKGVSYFSAFKAMCNAEGCITTLNGRADGLTSWDYGHLTTPAAQFLAGKLAESGLARTDSR